MSPPTVEARKLPVPCLESSETHLFSGGSRKAWVCGTLAQRHLNLGLSSTKGANFFYTDSSNSYSLVEWPLLEDVRQHLLPPPSQHLTFPLGIITNLFSIITTGSSLLGSRSRSLLLSNSPTASLHLETSIRRPPLPPSQVHLPVTFSDVKKTGVRGTPHLTRSLVSDLCQPEILHSPPCSSGVPSMFNRRSSSAQRRQRSLLFKMGLSFCTLGWASPLRFKDSHLFIYVSQPNLNWGGLVLLANPLKISDGFTGIFTETSWYTLQHPSCSKSFLGFQVPVDSLDKLRRPSSSLLSIEERPFSPYAFSLRSSFPLVLMWRSLSISIIDLLSCGAVRLGPEDATEFVLATFRDADWIITSHFKVTISQASGAVVILVLTHSSVTLNSLSVYLRGFSKSIFHVLLSFVLRVCLNSYLNCSSNV